MLFTNLTPVSSPRRSRRTLFYLRSRGASCRPVCHCPELESCAAQSNPAPGTAPMQEQQAPEPISEQPVFEQPVFQQPVDRTVSSRHGSYKESLDRCRARTRQRSELREPLGSLRRSRVPERTGRSESSQALQHGRRRRAVHLVDPRPSREPPRHLRRLPLWRRHNASAAECHLQPSAGDGTHLRRRRAVARSPQPLRRDQLSRVCGGVYGIFDHSTNTIRWARARISACPVQQPTRSGISGCIATTWLRGAPLVAASTSTRDRSSRFVSRPT